MQDVTWVLIVYLIPLLLAGVALPARHQPGPNPTFVLRAARIATWTAFLASFVIGGVVWSLVCHLAVR